MFTRVKKVVWLPALVLTAAMLFAGAPASADPTATADLSVTARVLDASQATLGGEVSISVTVTNHGPDDAPRVVLRTPSLPDDSGLLTDSAVYFDDPLPAGQSVVSKENLEVVREKTTSLHFAVDAPGVNDPNPANNTASVHVKALPALHTYTELRDPVWSPTGDRLAFVRWSEPAGESPYPSRATSGRIYLVARDGTRREAVTPSQFVQTGLSWSPDGTKIAYISRGHIWTVDVATHAVDRLTNYRTIGLDRFPTWSPDGNWIAYGTGDRFGALGIAVVPSTGGTRPVLLSTGGDGPPSWSRDGKYLAGDGQVWAADGRWSRVSPPPPLTEWTVDGVHLQSGLNVEDARTGAIVETMPPPPHRELSCHSQLSPDASAIALMQCDGRVYFARYADHVWRRAPNASSAHDKARWSVRDELAYVATSRCGPRSEIDAVASDGSHRRALADAC